MPIIIVVLAFILILVGLFAPITDQSTRNVQQSYRDAAVTENNEFADSAAANFSQLKVNAVMGTVRRDLSQNAAALMGMQLVQYRIYQNPAFMTALATYTPGSWPVPANTMQGFFDEAHGTIPNLFTRGEPVSLGERTIQRSTIRIERLRFSEWTLVDQGWLDQKFGPAGAGYSRWVARVDIESTEIFWKDFVGLNGLPFDEDGSNPCLKCTSPNHPTRGVSMAATAYKRSIEVPVCFGLPGVASPSPCNDPQFSFITPLGVSGNACSPPDCANHVVNGQDGCGPFGFDYSFQLVRQ